MNKINFPYLCKRMSKDENNFLIPPMSASKYMGLEPRPNTSGKAENCFI